MQEIKEDRLWNIIKDCFINSRDMPTVILKLDNIEIIPLSVGCYISSLKNSSIEIEYRISLSIMDNNEKDEPHSVLNLVSVRILDKETYNKPISDLHSIMFSEKAIENMILDLKKSLKAELEEA